VSIFHCAILIGFHLIPLLRSMLIIGLRNSRQVLTNWSEFLAAAERRSQP
jgi:hypothetical protein